MFSLGFPVPWGLVGVLFALIINPEKIPQSSLWQGTTPKLKKP